VTGSFGANLSFFGWSVESDIATVGGGCEGCQAPGVSSCMVTSAGGVNLRHDTRTTVGSNCRNLITILIHHHHAIIRMKNDRTAHSEVCIRTPEVCIRTSMFAFAQCVLGSAFRNRIPEPPP
jgi:uncharacterized membrane protein